MNCVERWLVLVAHDEMVAQSNNAAEQYWVWNNEFQLRKKGVGRGIHLSEVICSTVGHMVEAGQMLEYGKNHEGYWTGETFVKQTCGTIVTELWTR